MKESLNNNSLEKIFDSFTGLSEIANNLGQDNFETLKNILITETPIIASTIESKIQTFNQSHGLVNDDKFRAIEMLDEINGTPEFTNILSFMLPEYKYLILEFDLDKLVYELLEYHIENILS